LLENLVEVALSRMIDEARLPTLVRWIEFATDNRMDSPTLEFAEAEVFFKRGDLRCAEALAAQAARRFPKAHPLESGASWLAGLSAHVTSRHASALQHFDLAVSTAQNDRDCRQALWGRFLATTAIDNTRDAERLLSKLHQLSGASADEVIRVATGRLMLTSLTGDAQHVLDEMDVLAPLAVKTHDPLVHSSFLNVYSALLSLGGRYEDALTSAQREIEVASLYGLEFAMPHARFQRALALHGLRSFQECRATLSTCERTPFVREHNFLRMNLGILRARLSLNRGVAQALKLFERHEHPRSNEAMEAEYFAWWSLALALAHESGRADKLAHRAALMSPRIEVSALVQWTRAVLAPATSRLREELASEAFRVSLATGNIDAFVTCYRACPEILGLLAATDQHHEPLKLILERARDHRFAGSAGLALPPAPGTEGLEVLSSREREVMELLSQGLLNKEIARTLFIAEGTVKVHVRSICQKLGARTRTEAVMRAAELSG
jgi:ATP/maltotriose-dependent transcriptional regulator MalT